MSEKFRNKYRIESARMRNWNHAWRGKFFITICTWRGTCWFGKMINGQMNLSAIGEIAASEWLKSPEIRPDMKLELDEYIIMPNHIHGIIRIKENEYNKFNNEIIPDFRWLSGFPEYLIRDESSLNNIRRYIIENPEQWTGDKFRTR